MVRIDDHVNPITINAGRIAPSQLGCYRIGMRIEHADADVERCVVVENADFGWLERCRALLWVALGEALYDGSIRPRLFIE